MAYRRPPNPYTKYGRKRMRDEAAQRIANYTPQERAEYDKIQTWFWVVIIGIALLIFFAIAAIKGPDAASDWVSGRKSHHHSKK